MFHPLRDFVLVRRHEAQERAGSILVPASARSKPLCGVVVAVGPGRVLDNGKRLRPEVSRGDTVTFTDREYAEIELEGTAYLIISERDILGTISLGGEE